MAGIITSDVANILIQSLLDRNTTSYQKTFERLSSGSKFTTVGDDPVGVSKTALLAAQISANTKARENIELGQDLLTMAENNQSLVISDLQRIQDLCVQAANETYSISDKNAIINEIKSRLANIDNIADATKFNEISILNGDSGNLTLQVGTSTTSTVNVGSALINVHVSQLGGDLNKDLHLDDTVTGETWAAADIKAYMEKVDSAITQLTGTAAQIGGYINRLESLAESLTSMNINLTENKSIISDADIAAESADLVKYQILQQATASILTQANQVPAMAIELLK